LQLERRLEKRDRLRQPASNGESDGQIRAAAERVRVADAQLGLQHLQRPLMHGDCLGRLVLHLVGVGEVIADMKREGMVAAQTGLIDSERRFEELDRVGQPAGPLIRHGQVIAAPERFDVVGSQLCLQPLEQCLVNYDRLGRPAGVREGQGQVIAAPERLIMVAPQSGIEHGQRLRVQAHSVVVQTQRLGRKLANYCRKTVRLPMWFSGHPRIESLPRMFPSGLISLSTITVLLVPSGLLSAVRGAVVVQSAFSGPKRALRLEPKKMAPRRLSRLRGLVG
jgi:hypothetical protein